MFVNSIDRKPIIVNPNDNNEIVDLTKSIFAKSIDAAPETVKKEEPKKEDKTE